MSDKQPIGYLMGLPIYEVDDMPDQGEVVMGKLTPEAAKRLMERAAAGGKLTKSRAILLIPKEDVQC